MKKILLLCTFFVCTMLAKADEGMWLPFLLGKKTYDEMVKKGLKLTKDQIWNINHSSLKDAIIIFGGGCTGEIVSNKGLIFTNHHCGYDAIASASSVEHNYLKDGFWAKDLQQEITTQLSVQFLLKIEDVTDTVLQQLGNLQNEARSKKEAEIFKTFNRKYSDSAKYIEARTNSLFKGNQYIIFFYQRYPDVRLVGTPPESIGKFGGDTDNWEWPRHTGDFSVFRVYANKEGQPTPYNANNVPLKPKYFLPVSIAGVRDGDFSMILGYPGGTNRYETSDGIKMKVEISNPSLVNLRDMRLKYMLQEMKKDPATKLKLASYYAGVANYWKFFDGESKQLNKYHIYEKKQAEEKKFADWAKGKPEFDSLFEKYKANYAAWQPYEKGRVYLMEGILGSRLLRFMSRFMSVPEVLKTQDTAKINALLKTLNQAREEFLQEEDIPSDKNIVVAALSLFYHDINKAQQPTAFYDTLQHQYGSLENPETYLKYSNQLFDNSLVLNNDKWTSFIKNPSVSDLTNDIAYQTTNSFMTNFTANYRPLYEKFLSVDNNLGRIYLKGIAQMNPTQERYPDATFTMRLSYGNVKNYRPRDAVFYDDVSTLTGMIEKYVPKDYEFDLPTKLIDLYNKKDFGQYKDPVKNDVVVNFITTNDITGGNSGSPVLNAKGELIGLAFDGNYEALSHKIAFDKDLNRTICLDVRYLLWCMDKLGGAKNIVDELLLMPTKTNIPVKK